MADQDFEKVDPVARLRSDLGLKKLNPIWAKLEILIGLAVVGASFHAERGSAIALFVLGGYLALAGSRSHLYQSMNVLTAHLATLIRDRQL